MVATALQLQFRSFFQPVKNIKILSYTINIAFTYFNGDKKWRKRLRVNGFDVFTVTFCLGINIATHRSICMFWTKQVIVNKVIYKYMRTKMMNKPHMMSRVHRVIKGYTSISFFNLIASWSCCIKFWLCSLNTCTKSSKILKWKVGVSIFRRSNHFLPIWSKYHCLKK
jgi:hypothetical protein